MGQVCSIFCYGQTDPISGQAIDLKTESRVIYHDNHWTTCSKTADLSNVENSLNTFLTRGPKPNDRIKRMNRSDVRQALSIKCPICPVHNVRAVSVPVTDILDQLAYHKEDLTGRFNTLVQEIIRVANMMICPECQAHVDRPDGRVATCQECNYQWCKKCSVYEEHHKNRDCLIATIADYLEKFPEDLELIKTEYSFCPECGNRVERNGGCDHMSCKCGADFCIHCMQRSSASSHGCDRAAEREKLINLARGVPIPKTETEEHKKLVRNLQTYLQTQHADPEMVQELLAQLDHTVDPELEEPKPKRRKKPRMTQLERYEPVDGYDEQSERPLQYDSDEDDGSDEEFDVWKNDDE